MDQVFAPAPEPKTELGRYRILSSTAGIRVSPLQLGAMSIGNAWSNLMDSMDKEQSFKLLDCFFEAGGNFIDTVNAYQDDESETWLGEWMATRRNRDQVVIATKYTTDYKSYSLGWQRTNSQFFRQLAAKTVGAAGPESALATLDILYVHWWDLTTSFKEIMDSLHVLVGQGKDFYLGVSDTLAWVVSAANEYATAFDKTPSSIYQGRWNIMLRDFEREIIPMARQYGMALAPWDVLGGGKIQTKKALEERAKKGEILHATQATRVFPMVGGRKIEHLKDNIQALSIKLSQEQVEYLESVKPFEVGFSKNFVGPDPHVTEFTGLAATSAALEAEQWPKPTGLT